MKTVLIYEGRMIRETSIEAYNKIKDNGLLSEKRLLVYEILFQHGPATAMELRRFFPAGIVDSQIRARLNELRTLGVAKEVRERPCSVTGMRVIEWDVTSRLPIKHEKPIKHECPTCKGQGYIVEQQARLF